MALDQKWLAGGQAVLVLDAGNGVPGDEDYAPALVAVLTTEYHEPAQILDADPLAGAGAAVDGPTTPGSGVPGELSGPITPTPAPQPAAGPATPDVSTRSTASEDPNVTAPGSPAAVGAISPAQILATLRDLTARADAGDADAQAQLAALDQGFEDYEASRDTRDDEGVPASEGPVPLAPATPQGGLDSPSNDTPETAPGGNGEAAGSADNAPASATGAGDAPTTV